MARKVASREISHDDELFMLRGIFYGGGFFIEGFFMGGFFKKENF